MSKFTTNLSFQPTLDEMLKTGKAGTTSLPITGASTTNNLIVIRNLHMELRAENTLEVGLAYGASALVFAQTHKDLGNDIEGCHVAIDPFQADMANSGLAALDQAGLGNLVAHLEDFSDRALPDLLARHRRFGLIYIDGSHLFEDVFVDVHYCAQLLEMGGIMLLDDSTHPDIAKVARFVRRNMQGVLDKVDLSPYRADNGKSLRYIVAQKLDRVQLTAFRKVDAGRRHWDAKLTQF